MKKLSLIIAGITLIAGAGAGIGVAVAAPGDPLVYICPQEQGPTNPNCQFSQEFEVFDHNGAPIYSIGEFGGDQVYGDNRSLFPPGTVFNPSIVESWESPQAYGKKTCVAPELWIEPRNLWACTTSGTWYKFLTIGLPKGKK